MLSIDFFLKYEKFGFDGIHILVKIKIHNNKTAKLKTPLTTYGYKKNPQRIKTTNNTIVIGSGILNALHLRESKDIDVVVTEKSIKNFPPSVVLRENKNTDMSCLLMIYLKLEQVGLLLVKHGNLTIC